MSLLRQICLAGLLVFFLGLMQEISCDAQEPAQLVLLTEFSDPPKKTVIDEWIADFQEKYPWITVEHRGVSNEFRDATFLTMMFGETPPDIFITESRAELLEFVNAGLVYDLTEWYAAHQERFIPGYELNSVINGRRYAIPWSILVLDLLWYNPRIMDKYGLDPTTISTWDDLIAMCAVLKQHGEIPFAFGGGGDGWPGGHWVMLLLQKSLSAEDIMKLVRREKKWTDPDVIAALSHLEELVKNGYLAPNAADNDSMAGQILHFQGQGAFWQAGSWHLYNKGSGLAPRDWKFKFIPFPDFSDATRHNVAISTSDVHWTVHKKSKHLDEALLFLDYLTRLNPAAELWVKDVQEFIALKGAVNAQTSGPEMLDIERYLETANVATALEYYLPRQVVLEGHWAGAIQVLGGAMDTKSWATLIEELHKAHGTLGVDE